MVDAAVITVSDGVSAGAREDRGGPAAVSALRDAGFSCPDPVVIPDGADSVSHALRAALERGARVVVTTGGTGVGPRDRTPEGTASVLDCEIPGIAEELRRRGVAETPGAMLSRGLAGVAGGTLVVNLPGSPKAVASGMPVVLSIAAHVLDQLDGGGHS